MWLCDLITARVRSTTGRLCFDTCLSIHLSVHRGGGSGPAGGEGWVSTCWVGGSGPPAGGGSGPARGGSGPAAGGGSGPAAGGGQVQLPGGGGQVQLRGGGGGVRSSCWGGGVRSSWQGGVRSSRWGGSAKIEQHREYLLHGGRYASCVHAGGLSCLTVTLL